jgi:hypothetical protein
MGCVFLYRLPSSCNFERTNFGQDFLGTGVVEKMLSDGFKNGIDGGA